ncbi:MAG: hypothetical protein LUD29_05645 [Clostridia bacterium]|nr:hypothetical protein [Clostridia bacterium]
MDTNTIIITVSVIVIVAVAALIVARIIASVRKQKKDFAAARPPKMDTQKIYDIRRKMGIAQGLRLDFFAYDNSAAGLIETKNLCIDEGAGKIFTFVASRIEGKDLPEEAFATDFEKIRDCKILVNNIAVATLDGAAARKGIPPDELQEYLSRLTSVATLSVSFEFYEEGRFPFTFPFISASFKSSSDATAAAAEVFKKICEIKKADDATAPFGDVGL